MRDGSGPGDPRRGPGGYAVRWMAAAWAAAAWAAIPWSATASVPPSPVYTEARHAATAGPLPALTGVVQAALPAVVAVITTQAPERTAGRDPLKDLFDRYHGDSARKGLGTGFVVHRDGYIVTNAHVVDGAASIEVTVGDGDEQRYPARVVGADEATDVALLKIEPREPLRVLPLGDSDRVSIAEWVMVIGNPFGLSHSVTLGIVSHTGRADIAPAGRDGFYDFIQTDASINPGNSGGPLIDLNGQVIGIATAINATGQGIGFAIPINMAKAILGQLREHGKVVRAWLGVSVQEPAPEAGPTRGVLVTDVVRDGPAARGGMHPGDLITSFDGHAVRTASRLRWYVSTAGVGRSVAVRVRRGDGSERSVDVRLDALPPSGVAQKGAPGPEPAAEAPAGEPAEN